MCWLTRLLQLTRERESDDIWTVSITDVVLENYARSPAALFASTATELHQVYFTDLILSAVCHKDVIPFTVLFTVNSITSENGKVKDIKKFTQINFQSISQV